MNPSDFPISLLCQGAQDLGISLEQAQLEAFSTYAHMLCEWNERINLTAITDPEGIAVRHFVDSLTLLAAANPKEGATLLDVGAGAGFPSVPCCLARPDLKPFLLDSLNKRLIFLQAVCDALGISAQLLHLRAEEAAQKQEHREGYDLVCARAVARLNALCEYCLPLVKVGGQFAALKGPDGEQELEEAQNAISLLGGKVKRVVPFSLSDGSERRVILIEKIRSTPTKYPRRGTKIAKNPL